MGSAIQSRLPWAIAMSNEDSDISETSNSLKWSWRQKISDGCATVQVRSMPSGEMDPSRTGRERSFAPMIRLSCSLAIPLPTLCLTGLRGDQDNSRQEVEGCET